MKVCFEKKYVNIFFKMKSGKHWLFMRSNSINWVWKLQDRSISIKVIKLFLFVLKDHLKYIYYFLFLNYKNNYKIIKV